MARYMYMRKTCVLCRKDAHTTVAADARCLYNHHLPSGVDHALRCVQFIFGLAAMDEIRAEVDPPNYDQPYDPRED